MAQFIYNIPDPDLATVETIVGIGKGNAWLQSNLEAVVKQCVDQAELKRREAAGIASVLDLTKAEIDPIIAARTAAKGG